MAAVIIVVSVSVLILLAVWVAVIPGLMPLWLALAFTILMMMFLGFFFSVRWLLARRRAKAIEEAILAQTTAAEGLRPDLVAEIESMTAEFNRAVGALKNSRVGGGGRGALSALPWYVIIGPPGSGKSTALRNSGLHFPYTPQHGRGAVRGLGGTRNCDWWLTNEAVLLDTAGRWTVQEDDDEWFTFLDLLKKHRGRRPLNGLLVAVSVDDLLNNTEGGRNNMAAKIRERVDEVMMRLELALPVYVLVTKCDLIPGFVEAFGDLAKSRRGTIWGFTLPFRDLGLQLYETLTSRFDSMVNALHTFSLGRLGQERRRESRGLIAEFPTQFNALRDPLAGFLTEMFRGNVYDEAPVLRGVYFTSGTQEGRPVDKTLARIAESTGLRNAIAMGEPVVEPKSYFLTQVFFDVLFKDARLVAPTHRSASRTQWFQITLGLALCAGAGLIAIGAASSWRYNSRFIDSTRDIVAELPEAPEQGYIPATIEPLRLRFDELEDHRQNGSPWRMGMALYRGGFLFEPVRNRYAVVLRDHVVTPVARADARELSAWGQTFVDDVNLRPTPRNHVIAYNALERYLRISATMPGFEVEPAQPELTDEDKTRLANALAFRWAEVNPPAGSTNEESRLNHTANYMRMMEELRLQVSRDPETVRLARIGLSKLNSAEVLLARILSRVEQIGTYDKSLNDLVGSIGSAITAGQRIRGQFTRAAWEEHVRGDIDEAALGGVAGEWVVGQTAEQSGERQCELRNELRRMYFDQYIEEWQQFIRSVSVRNVTADGEAACNETIALVDDLTRGSPGPLGRLIQGLAENVDLQEPPAPDPDDPDAAGGPTSLLGVAQRRAEERIGSQRMEVLRAAGADGTTLGSLFGGDEEVGCPPLLATNVRQHFQPLTDFAAGQEGASGYAAYQEELLRLRDAIRALRGGGSDSEFEPVFNTANDHTERVIQERETGEIGAHPLLQLWLRPPLTGAGECAGDVGPTVDGRSFCQTVTLDFYRSFDRRYPFVRQARDEVPLADFTRFYAPNSGVIWSFYSSVLENRVLTRAGSNFEFANRPGVSVASRYRSTLPLFYRRSLGITESVFPPGASAPHVDFEVTFRGIPAIRRQTLSIGGASADYRNGPDWKQRIAWPGPDPTQGASLAIEGLDGNRAIIRFEGDWAFFRLIERAQVSGGGVASNHDFNAIWHMEGQNVDVQLSFRMIRTPSPLFSADDSHAQLMGPFRRQAMAPDIIAQAGERCPVRN